MMSYDELKAVFTGILDKQNIPHTWHSFIQIPKNHCFGTYNISEADFDGADLVAMYRHDTISLCLFYHDGKTDEDFALEEELEEAVRPAAEYSKRNYFDSQNGLFYSVYTFKCDMQLD